MPAGEAVVKQGDPGDYFYVLKSGRAQIVRRMSSDGDLKDVTLAELHPGDVFGEDALIGDAPRNASVVMTVSGSLMRLGKEDFRVLMQDPIMRYIDFDEFQEMMRDVDSKVEHSGQSQSAAARDAPELRQAGSGHHLRDGM